jgi:hypothetical protein
VLAAAFVAPCDAAAVPVFDPGFEQAPKTRSRMSRKQARRDIGFSSVRNAWTG